MTFLAAKTTKTMTCGHVLVENDVKIPFFVLFFIKNDEILLVSSN